MTWRKTSDPRAAGRGPVDAADVRRRLQSVFCSAAQVRTAYLFGSQAHAEAGPRSDIDVAIWFDGELTERELVDLTIDLAAHIAKALGRDDIDLVALDGADPELCNDAVRGGMALYEREPDSVAYDRCRALHAWIDVKELREREIERVLARWRQPRAKT